MIEAGGVAATMVRFEPVVGSVVAATVLIVAARLRRLGVA